MPRGTRAWRTASSVRPRAERPRQVEEFPRPGAAREDETCVRRVTDARDAARAGYFLKSNSASCVDPSMNVIWSFRHVPAQALFVFQT